MEVPRYTKLSAGKIWPLIKEIDDISVYFSDYTSKQKSNRDIYFQYSPQQNVRYLKIINNALIKKSKVNDSVDDRYIFI